MPALHSFIEVAQEFTDFSSDFLTDTLDAAFDATSYRTCALEVNVVTLSGTSPTVTVKIESAIEPKGGFRAYETIGPISATGRNYGWVNEFENAGTDGEVSLGHVRLRLTWGGTVTAFSCTARALFK